MLVPLRVQRANEVSNSIHHRFTRPISGRCPNFFSKYLPTLSNLCVQIFLHFLCSCGRFCPQTVDQIQRKIALILKMTFCQLESRSLPSMMKPEWPCDFFISDYSEEKSWKMLNGRWKFSSENKKAHAQLQIGGISWLCRRSKRWKTQL